MLKIAASALFSLLTLAVFAPTAHARVEVEAYPGRPFGVGRVTITMPPEVNLAAIESRAYELADPNGRTHYPSFNTSGAPALLRGILGGGTEVPRSLTVLFLFDGNEPLDVTVYSPHPVKVRITPRVAARQHTRLLKRWWREYNASVRQQQNDSDYPSVLETYLTSMLSKRLGLATPLLSRGDQQPISAPTESFDLLMGTEKLRLATIRETMSQKTLGNEAADQPVPTAIRWSPLVLPPTPKDVQIEAQAFQVPENCFYIRFGKFENYLWLNKLLEENGGDLSRMITLRGSDPQLGEKLRNQLALKQSATAELFGPTIIADVSLLGRDLFMNEGAAIGILFEAKNSFVLSNQLNADRTAALRAYADRGSKLETIEIAGHKVSALTTPDNSLRSFYATKDKYHLVTTSKSIVEQFLLLSETKASLGNSAEFRHARARMPVDREDTVFVYMSSSFFSGLLSPQYRIELRRRLESATDIELVHLARLAAQAEGFPGKTIDELSLAGVVPRGFGRRADGSGPVIETSRIVDSLRGARGYYTPVPDIDLRGVTRREAARFQEVRSFHEDSWQQMDPLMVGIRRYALDKNGKERIVIDAEMSPFGKGKYGSITKRIGPPLKKRVTPAPDDVAFVQGVMLGEETEQGVLLHHMFVGVKDIAPLVDLSRGTNFLTTLRLLQTTPGYLGGWPKPGVLDRLPLGLAPQADAAGYSQMLFGLWRREWNDISVLSFSRPLLEEVSERLRIEDVEEAAQVRINIGDLSSAKIAPMTKALAYVRSRQASLGNARLLHSFSQQLRVPREQARDVAQQVLHTQLVCSLGGEYKLAETPGQLPEWVSSKWADQGAGTSAVANAFDAPFLHWFRGLNARLIMEETNVVAHIELDMQRANTKTKVELPFFNLFGGEKKPEEKPEEAPREF